MAQYGEYHRNTISSESQTEHKGIEFVTMKSHLFVIKRLKELVEAYLLLFVECKFQRLFAEGLQIIIDGFEAKTEWSHLLTKCLLAVLKHVAPATTLA